MKSKQLSTLNKLREKAMKNIRKKYPGTHAIDVDDKDMIKMGGFTAREEKMFIKLNKILNKEFMGGY